MIHHVLIIYGPAPRTDLIGSDDTNVRNIPSAENAATGHTGALELKSSRSPQWKTRTAVWAGI
jgi:hypothetical protein